MLPDHLGEIVLELPLALERLLRNVGVGAKRFRRCIERHQRRTDLAGDQVVPVLPSDRRHVHRCIVEDRVQRQVRNLQMVHGEVAVVQIAGAV